jgi:hypothetical protein
MNLLLRAGITTMVAFGAAAPAQAAERLATPDGSTTDDTCTVVPCQINRALFKAQPGDLVTVAPGTYVPTGRLSVGSGVTLRGAPGQAIPTIAFSQDIADTALATSSLTIDPSTAVVRRLRIEQTATLGAAVSVIGVDLVAGGTAEQVQVVVGRSAPGAFLTGLRAANGAVVRDSIVRLTSPGFAAGTGNALLLNTTILSPGTGVSASPCSELGASPSATTTVVNSVVRAGDGAADTDLAGFSGPCTGGGPTLTGTVAVSSSSYRGDHVGAEVQQGAGNQTTAAPLLDATGAPLAGSPTIDAGAAHAALGAADVVGGARVSGAAPDIGAAEFVAPAPPPPGPPPGGTGNPPPAGAGGGGGQDLTAPALSAIKLKSARVKAGASVSLALRLTEAATVTIRFERLVPGHWRGRRCSATARRGARCTIVKAAGSITRTVRAGAGTLALGSRVGGRKLAPGTYRLTITARDAAGNRSKAAAAKLVVTR